MIIICTALLVFLYHYERNGNPWHFKDNIFPRLIWSLGNVVALGLLMLPDKDFYLYAEIFIMSFAAILVPHAYAQNMGRWPEPQNKWPSFFMPNLTKLQWDAMPMSGRERVDAIKMGCVGLVRGAIVFMPAMVWSPVLNCLAATVITAASQPLAYFLGWRTPWATFGNRARSAEWGEFYIGIGWAAAYWVLTGFHLWR